MVDITLSVLIAQLSGVAAVAREVLPRSYHRGCRVLCAETHHFIPVAAPASA
jgi:hypothetical protein